MMATAANVLIASTYRTPKPDWACRALTVDIPMPLSAGFFNDSLM